ncbi:hypothetical protein PDESU_04106 [Pontiella desulfatans]|uniref:HTH arsR-type domain-containing protein n=2 Tax=Pontiella desulfatans TaxID=2750659 RepID=A0A6C2U616_PONDE|nr:hypothetical protein PDESU_04106 [Pontiella desulfatans]
MRLEMLSLLNGRPPMFVQAIGEQLGCSEDVASKQLQLLADGDFLSQERKGRFLFYSGMESDRLGCLVLEESLRDGADLGSIMKSLTAFTHERRILIVRELAKGARVFEELCGATGISLDAMKRHLRKLEGRGFVERRDGCWHGIARKDRLGKDLLRIVLD